VLVLVDNQELPQRDNTMLETPLSVNNAYFLDLLPVVDGCGKGGQFTEGQASRDILTLLPVAWAYLWMLLRLGKGLPDSILAMTDCVVPIRSATSFCVNPDLIRAWIKTLAKENSCSC
jgi:hypothetical protein